MAAFDLYFAPTVSASVDAGDSDLWTDAFYGGTLENDWENVGTNARLTEADGSAVSWNTIALGSSARRLDLSSFVSTTGGATLATHAAGWATVSAISLVVNGWYSVSSLDLTTGGILAGMRQQASGGIFTPSPGGGGDPQFFDTNVLFNNGGAGVGIYDLVGEIPSTDAIAGLTSANAIAMFLASTFQTRILVLNETSTVFTFNWDRINIRITGTTGSLPVETVVTSRSRTNRPLWFSRGFR